MKEICVKADVEYIDEVYGFVESELEASGVSRKDVLMFHMIVDEIFSNIVNYAYEGESGNVWISYRNEDMHTAMITFTDEGRPFNPLQQEDPDVTLPVCERRIGGLGVFMVRQTVDDINYEYSDGKNILTIVKKTGGEHV